MAKKELDLLATLKKQVESVSYDDEGALDAWRRRAEMVVRKIFGPDSKYLLDLQGLDFYPMSYPAEPSWERRCWENGKRAAANLISTMAEELTLCLDTQAPTVSSRTGAQAAAPSNSVFVVHGHDDAMKEAVARTLEKLGLDPVILHEKPNKSRTIIQKFTDYATVSFAVVLLSPDDIGRKRTQSNKHIRPRARQNVVFELGFFLGKLGHERVVSLYRNERNFEIPSDYSGVLFVPYDVAGRWKFDLVRELKLAGYSVDANKLLE